MLEQQPSFIPHTDNNHFDDPPDKMEDFGLDMDEPSAMGSAVMSQAEEHEKLLSETDQFLRNLNNDDNNMMNETSDMLETDDELNDMLEKAEHLAAMMRSFSTDVSNRNLMDETGKATAAGGAGAGADPPGASPFPANKTLASLAEETTPAANMTATPPKQKRSSSTPTAMSVAVKSVQSEVSSVASSTSGPFDNQIKALSSFDANQQQPQADDDDMLIPPIKMPAELEETTDPVPKLTPTSQMTDENSRPYLVRSPGQGEEEDEESDASPEISTAPDLPSSPPGIERKPQPPDNAAFSKSPAGLQSKLVQWEKVATANEGDDDYVPLVDYSKKKNDISKDATSSSLQDVDDPLLRSRRRNLKKKEKSSTLSSMVSIVTLAGVLYFVTQLLGGGGIEKTTSNYVFPEKTFDTEFVTGWPSEKGGQSFDVTEITGYFAYEERIAQIYEEMETVLSQRTAEERKKLEACKKPFAGMRFAWCRDLKKDAKKEKRKSA